MIRREAIREYANGSLWVFPAISAVVALFIGWLISRITVNPGSAFAFPGTEDDARALLMIITGTVVTVIALVLGLTVVALQLSSTQFSPRLLRNFLRDRPTLIVLSTFVATFAYSAAGLYTVGLSAGGHTEDFPRLAVSGAVVLLFACLGMVVYFADHLAHSIQVDVIGKVVEKSTLAVVHGRIGSDEHSAPEPPAWAIPITAIRSGYVQTAHPERLLPMVSRHRLHVLLRFRVGDHIVAGTTVGWCWHPDPDDPRSTTPVPAVTDRAVDQAIRIGFERTMEQDAAFGIRQLIDMACKALSPAVNDPYTAVQAVDHLSVIFCSLAVRPLGDHVAVDPDGRGEVIVPGRRFGDYLATACGLIRRFGAAEPTLVLALLQLLDNCASLLPAADIVRWAAIGEQCDLILDDAVRSIAQPADVASVRSAAQTLQHMVALRIDDSSTPPL